MIEIAAAGLLLLVASSGLLFAVYAFAAFVFGKIPLDTSCWQTIAWGLVAIPFALLVGAAVAWCVPSLEVAGGVGIVTASLLSTLFLHRATDSRRVVVGGLAATALALTALAFARFIPEHPAALGGATAVVIGWHACYLWALVAWSVDSRRRNTFTRPGYCRHCGYDLCGVPGDLCPECGVRDR